MRAAPSAATEATTLAPNLASVPRVYDVSVPIRAGGVVYPGNPEIGIEAVKSVARGDTSTVSAVRFGSHTGTHVDAASHFFADGATVDQLALDVLMGPALLLRFEDEVRAISADDLAAHDIGQHTRVLFSTRNSRGLLQQREFVPDYTYLAPDGAAWLVERGVKLVGVDYYSVEQFRSGHHRSHRTLLTAGVVIVEGLDLSEPPPGEYELVCLPLRLEGVDGAPARAVLVSRTDDVNASVVTP